MYWPWKKTTWLAEAGHEETAVRVNDAALRRGRGARRLNGKNAIAVKDDGAIGEFVAGGRVDDGDVIDGEGSLRRSLREGGADQQEA
jgi:hypothetical protein